MLETLKTAKQSDLSDKLIEMSEKLSKIRLSELRANRESGELKEKQNYMSRLLKQQIDSIKKLEEQTSDFESRMHKKEEEFRRADNERMRRFFNARFDDIPGALQGPGGAGDGGFSPSRRRDTSVATLSRDRSEYVGPVTSMHAEPYKRLGSNVGSGGGNASEHDVKFLEGKVKKLTEELKNATDEIRSREAIINRFKEW